MDGIDGFEAVLAVYGGSDGEATKALYARLAAVGPAGVIAMNLFRAQKASSRAKVYRGGIRGRGSYRSMAYDRKGWALERLVEALCDDAEALGIAWGWGVDTNQPHHRDVLYVEVPTGQVSFHSAWRGDGPDYGKEWDRGRGVGPIRVCAWAARLLAVGEDAIDAAIAAGRLAELKAAPETLIPMPEFQDELRL